MRALMLSSLLLLLACGDKDPATTDDTGGGDDGGDDGGDEGGGDEGGDDGDDTGGGDGACATPVATFKGTDGSEKDVTEFFESGEYLTLALPGTLEVCPGTWFARILVRADMDIVGLGDLPKETILSGGESGTIIDIAGPNVTVNVSNIRLDRGAGLDVDHNSGGGGIYCEQSGVVNGTDLIFTDNFANDGPAIYTRECTVSLSNVVMKDNVAEDDGGAATFWFSDVTMDDVRMENNVALDGGGMAMFNSTFVGTGLNVEGNAGSNFAGGIWVYDSTFTLSDSTISSNTNEDGTYAGGLLLYGTGDLDNVSFDNNAASVGGGLFVYYEAEVEADSCSFSGNTPEDIYVADYSSAGGYAMTGSSDFSFSCSSNVCSEK